MTTKKKTKGTTKAKKVTKGTTKAKKVTKDAKLWAFAHCGTLSGWEGPINLLPLRYHSGMTLEEVKVAHKKAYLEGYENDAFQIECATEEAEEIQGAWVVEKSLWKVLDRTIGIASSDTGAAIEKNNAKIVLNESAVKVIGRTIAECEAEEAAREEEKRRDKEERGKIMKTLGGYSTAELKALVIQTKAKAQHWALLHDGTVDGDNEFSFRDLVPYKEGMELSDLKAALRAKVEKEDDEEWAEKHAARVMGAWIIDEATRTVLDVLDAQGHTKVYSDSEAYALSRAIKSTASCLAIKSLVAPKELT